MSDTNSSSNLETESAYAGKFCWEKIEGVTVPFLIRSSGELLAELNMLKQTLYKKHLKVLNDWVFCTACPNFKTTSFLRMTEPERELLNEINIRRCDRYITKRSCSIGSNFLMKKEEAVKLYNILEVFYRIVVEKNLDNLKCGFIKIANNKTPVPFLDVENVGLVVPVFFFESPQVALMAFTLSDHWTRSYLELCCRLLSIQLSFYKRSSVQVIRLEALKEVIPEAMQLSIFRELPPTVEVISFLRHRERTCQLSKIEKPGTTVIDTITIEDSSDDDDDGSNLPNQINDVVTTTVAQLPMADVKELAYNNTVNVPKWQNIASGGPYLQPSTISGCCNDAVITATTTVENVRQSNSSLFQQSWNIGQISDISSHVPSVIDQQAETLEQTEMMVQASGKTRTVIKESRTLAETGTHMSSIMVQKPASTVQQSKTLVKPPETLLQQPVDIVQHAGTMILATGTMINPSNVTAGKILQPQGNVPYLDILSQQGVQRTSVDSSSCATTINTFDLQNIMTSIPHSEINATSGIVVFPSGNSVRSGTMIQTSAGLIPNTSLIATQNGIMTPPVPPLVIACQNVFLENGNMVQITNSGQILTNPSVIMIKPNNAAGICAGTPEPNSLSGFQNIIATSKGSMVYPNIIPNSTNNVTNQGSNIVTQLNNTVFHNNCMTNKNTVITSKDSITEMSNQPKIILESSNMTSQNTFEITGSNNFINSEPDQDEVDFYSNIIKTEPNKDQSEKIAVVPPEADLTLPRTNTVIKMEIGSSNYTYQNSTAPKNEFDEIDIGDTKIENRIPGVQEGDDLNSPSQNVKNATSTLISDENTEKIVLGP